ncbi:MAG: protease complex subunit PrcB family protein [Acidobacteriota bacterium]|nr:hypothetical protein [Blastocatellia bacterium]MDW8412208.1 protease complex subunit PrcB family protein [Acidobacteriota bacterium]
MKICRAAGLMVALMIASGNAAAQTPIKFETIEKNNVSGYRYAEANFKGADFLIKDKGAWKKFWNAHSKQLQPLPSPPKINFKEEMVVVTILGTQPTGGPSTEISEVLSDEKCDCLIVRIKDDERQGFLTVITNPFHIIKLPKSEKSLLFEHEKVEGSGSLP